MRSSVTFDFWIIASSEWYETWWLFWHLVCEHTKKNSHTHGLWSKMTEHRKRIGNGKKIENIENLRVYNLQIPHDPEKNCIAMKGWNSSTSSVQNQHTHSHTHTHTHTCTHSRLCTGVPVTQQLCKIKSIIQLQFNWDVEYVSVVLFCYILDTMFLCVKKKKFVDKKINNSTTI